MNSWAPYHDTFPTGQQERYVNDIFSKACGSDYRIERIIEVKSFAPSVSHFVADVRVFPSDRFA